MRLQFNPSTRAQLDQLSSTLPHALLLYGEPGVGLLTAARHLAGRDLCDVIITTDIDGKPDTTAKGQIRIDQIRQLIQTASLRSSSRRVFIIDDADSMNIAAQNALLKLLEEPPVNVRFILTAHQPESLLPTTLSRLQRVHIKPIDEYQSRQLVATLGVNDDAKLAQLLFLASGRPAELSRLISTPADFTRKASLVQDARKLLQGTALERATIASNYHSSRSDALELLTLTAHLLQRSISATPSQTLIDKAQTVARVYEAIEANGNVRLQLMTLVV